MKKRMFIGILTGMVLMLTACGNATDTSQRTPNTSSKTTQEVLDAQIAAAQEKETPTQDITPTVTEEITPTETITPTAQISPAESVNIDYNNIDVDLTQMSSTVVYSEVYSMLLTPKDYEGLVVKMSGGYTYAEGETQIYHACIIADATACCQQGIEFVPADTAFVAPEVGTTITVTGTFSIYYEGSNMYVTLKDAVVEY